MKTRNITKIPSHFKKKTEREHDSEKEPAINPINGLPFKYVWAMSIPGEECGNPLVSKCPSKKFKVRSVCVLSQVNGRVFHFPRCYTYAELSTEELEQKKRKKSANIRETKIREYQLA